MTRFAMPISKRASASASTFLAIAASAALLAAPLSARAQGGMGGEPDVEDVAKTPLTDLNLAKDPIPDQLLAAAKAPYASDGLDDCGEIGGAIAELDAVLGPDLDVADAEGGAISVGRIAQSAIGSFIPFRSIVREITGAADHQRQFQAAIVAGAIRRGYLKGLGQQMGCSYPARPAFAKVRVDEEKGVEWEDRNKPPSLATPPAPRDREGGGTDEIIFVSEEVVQDIGG